MPENLRAYRKQLRRYLHLRGIPVGANDELACPNPAHQGETLALLTEHDPQTDWIECPSCLDKRDVFDVCGFLDNLDNHNKRTFPSRVDSVKKTLATVEAVVPPEIAEKPIAQWTDEELAAQAHRERQASKATVASRAEIDRLKIEEKRRQHQEKAQGELPFTILGTADDGLTYFLDRAERLQALRLGSLSKTQLQLLAPITWWLTQFPGARGRLEVDSAVDFVIEASNGKDFNLGSLRGRGAWRETGGLAYHDGQRTYRIPEREPDPGLVYQRKAALDLGLDREPASADTRMRMYAAASRLSFETPADCARLLAWALLAPFCGSLPWRPAGFLTGASKSGKSTILRYVVTRLCAHALYVSGESTEAYIRQEMGNDVPPVIVDEAEADDERGRRHVMGLISLMRQSTSDDAPLIGKGSSMQRPIRYNTRSMFLFSAITQGYEKQADANRLFLVDLKRPEGDWQEVRAQVTDAFTPETCAGVRAFVWQHLAEIIAQAEPLSLAIMDAAGFDTRYALLEGILWAAHWRVWRDRWPAAAELREWLAKVYLTKVVEQPEDDAVVLLDRLLAEVVQLQDSPAHRYTVQHMAMALSSGMELPEEPDGPAVILRPEQAERYRKTLNLYGLHVPHRGEWQGELTVALRHQWVAKVLGAGMGYAKVLSRHPQCTTRGVTITPTGETSRKCLVFSRGVLEGEPPI